MIPFSNESQDVSLRLSQRVQTRSGAQIHHAIGDGWSGEGLFIEIHPAQFFELLAGSEDDDFATLADSIEAPIDPDRRTVAAVANPLPPMHFASRRIETSDHPAVRPQEEEVIFDHEAGNEGHAFRDIVNEFAFRTSGLVGTDCHEALPGQPLPETAEDEVIVELRGADRAIIPELVDLPTDLSTLQVDCCNAVSGAGEDGLRPPTDSPDAWRRVTSQLGLPIDLPARLAGFSVERYQKALSRIPICVLRKVEGEALGIHLVVGEENQPVGDNRRTGRAVQPSEGSEVPTPHLLPL